jgi:Metallo-peptidase family M12B Reprolysin-like
MKHSKMRGKSTKSISVLFGLLFAMHLCKAQAPCMVKLLVAYTPEVADSAGGDKKIVAQIQHAVEKINESYVNSRINHWVELVRTVKWDFVESGCFQDDLASFQQSAYIDTLRNRYHADVAALLITNNQFCGLAVPKNAVATSATAYCAVQYECMVHNYSLAHQIGHLYGCQHNKYELDTVPTRPFPYANGYNWVYSDCANFRTIMALDDDESCEGQADYNCTIIPYWSNPEVFYLGVPTGTRLANNARVLNEQAPTLANFKPLPAYYLITDTVAHADYALAMAIDSMTTGAQYLIKDSAKVFFASGKKIILEPGFKADFGTQFETNIVTAIVNCSIPPTARKPN